MSQNPNLVRDAQDLSNLDGEVRGAALAVGAGTFPFIRRFNLPDHHVGGGTKLAFRSGRREDRKGDIRGDQRRYK